MNTKPRDAAPLSARQTPHDKERLTSHSLPTSPASSSTLDLPNKHENKNPNPRTTPSRRKRDKTESMSTTNSFSSSEVTKHPIEGGKWINPEVVHDNIGHPTLGGTYPAGRRFSKRIAQKKWLAKSVLSQKDTDIGFVGKGGADTATESETEAGTEFESEIEKSDSVHSGESGRHMVDGRLLDRISEESSEDWI